MRTVEEETWEVHQVLTDESLPYVIIGGAAVQIWGEPRFTKDLDLTVLAPVESLSDTIEQLLARLEPRADNVLELAQRARVLLVQTSTGYPVDISFGLPGYEDEVIRRAVEQEIAPGRTVLFCSAEDLIIHKSIAGRIQDMLDIQSIILRQKDKLDLTHIRYWLRVFSDLLETSDVINRFEQAWRQYGPES
jgi:hypothetical protein